MPGKFHLSMALPVGLAAVLLAGAAQAHSCGAAAPAPGTVLRGPVLEVVDGGRLCVALGALPDQWVALRLTDAGRRAALSAAGPNPRGTLMAAAFAQNLVCRTGGQADGETLAACTLRGRPLEALVADPSTAEAGRAWR